MTGHISIRHSLLWAGAAFAIAACTALDLVLEAHVQDAANQVAARLAVRTAVILGGAALTILIDSSHKRARSRMVSRLALLSADERQVMSLRARGLDMLQVRSLLGISDARLVKLLDGAYHKLGIASLEEFVEWELEAATSPVLTAGRGDQAGVQMRLVA